MGRSFVRFIIVILTLSLFAGTQSVFAENHHRGMKAFVGVAVIAGSAGLWWHFDKEVKRLEKVQKLFDKIKGVDLRSVQRLKELLLYKHISLFMTLLGCGYTIKQVGCLIRERVEQEEADKAEEPVKQNKDEEEDVSIESGDGVGIDDLELRCKTNRTSFLYDIRDKSSDTTIFAGLVGTNKPGGLERRCRSAWEKIFREHPEIDKRCVPVALIEEFYRDLKVVVGGLG